MSGEDGAAAVAAREEDIPAELSYPPELDSDAQLYLLDDFACSSDGKLRGLEVLEAGHARRAAREPLVALGVVREADAQGNPVPDGKALRVELQAVTDWCIDYANGGAVWLVTPRAWFRLLRPAPAYAPLFQLTRRRMELAVRAAAVLNNAPQASYDYVVARILAPPPPPGGTTLAEARGSDTGTRYSEASLLGDARFLLAQLSEAVPLAREASARATSFLARLDEQCGGAAQARRRRAIFAYTPPPFDPDNDNGVLAARNAALLARMDWRPGTSSKRARTAKRRGRPPTADTRFGVDAPLVGDVLTLWDFFIAFGAFLRLPPFPLSRLAAALCPGAAITAGAASGALLRDLHNALLRVIAGADLAPQPQPLVARADGTAGWAEAARASLLSAPSWLVDDDAVAAATALQDADYADLPAAQRIAILRALVSLALECEAFRDHVAQRVEDVPDSREAQEPLPWECSDPDPAAVLSLASPWEAWAAWAARVAPTSGRPLAEDLEGRRYWVLAGAVGWGRVFVQDASVGGDDAVAAWACYTWNQLPDLAAWLEAGGLKSAAERVLLRALRRLPPLPEGSVLPAAWQLSPCIARVQGRLKREGLSDEGPDGYTGIVAPLLHGPAAAGVDAQVRAQVHALLCAVPFWQFSQERLARLRLVVAAAAALAPGASLGTALLELESLLSEAGALLPSWAPLRAAWRLEASRCRTLAAAALPAAQLHDALAPDAARLSPPAFLRLVRAVQVLPPYTPAAGQSVVLLRTGLRAQSGALGMHSDPALWAALRPVERFRVELATFRRGDPAAEGQAGLHTCWLLLAPHPDALTHLGGGFRHGLCVPVCAAGLPDCVLDAEVYDRSLLRPWAAGDRFRMFFGTGGPEVLPGRRPGSYFKGTIARVHLRVELSAVGGARFVDVDPWEAYEVDWDHESRRRRGDASGAAPATCERLSPWEMETPEGQERFLALERVRKVEEARKAAAQQAQQAALQRSVARSLANVGASRAVVPPPQEEFLARLAAFFAERGRALRVPTFCHAPLDLYRAFVEVQKLGGYNAVTASKRWRDVCLALEVDLTHQTSAAFALRSNYERLLIAFERHLAGEDAGDAAARGEAGNAGGVCAPDFPDISSSDDDDMEQ